MFKRGEGSFPAPGRSHNGPARLAQRTKRGGEKGTRRVAFLYQHVRVRCLEKDPGPAGEKSVGRKGKVNLGGKKKKETRPRWRKETKRWEEEGATG